MFGFPIGFPEKIRLKDLKILKKKTHLDWKKRHQLSYIKLKIAQSEFIGIHFVYTSLKLNKFFVNYYNFKAFYGSFNPKIDDLFLSCINQ